MGKKGKELREQRALNAKFTFTAAQLAERDQKLLESKRQEIIETVRRKFEAEIEHQENELDKLAIKKRQELEEEWQRREELFKDAGPISELMSLLLSVSSRVLVEQFKWKPIPKDGNYDRRHKLVQFNDALVKELTAIGSDQTKDIRKYCDETYELYGVRFICEDDNSDPDNKS